jgi:hypothetical protein
MTARCIGGTNKVPIGRPPIGVHNPYTLPSYRDYGPYRKQFLIIPIGVHMPYRGSFCPTDVLFDLYLGVLMHNIS